MRPMPRAGAKSARPGGADLADEAIWLGRLVVSLLPEEPEAKGMLALMLYAEARRAARRGPDGAYVPLERQDPGSGTSGGSARRRRCCGPPMRAGRAAATRSRQPSSPPQRGAGSAGRRQLAGGRRALRSPAGDDRLAGVALNRAVALAGIEGPTVALAAIESARRGQAAGGLPALLGGARPSLGPRRDAAPKPGRP